MLLRRSSNFGMDGWRHRGIVCRARHYGPWGVRMPHVLQRLLMRTGWHGSSSMYVMPWRTYCLWLLRRWLAGRYLHTLYDYELCQHLCRKLKPGERYTVEHNLYTARHVGHHGERLPRMVQRVDEEVPHVHQG